ncbi:hypothetical protein BJ170DRAFT_607055 [Xylariales sp. AK1849]|nr:hypothetical protein BJ170DRAFT_607055 [Xylariales sp. AK1849]
MKGRGFAPSTLNEWTRLGAEVGINFSWQHGRTGNSRDSHKLLRLALESTPTMARSSSFTQAFSRGPAPGQETSTAQPLGARGPQTQMRLVETIYREYFENNYDLSDRSWLLSLGTSLLNIPAAEIQDCLESEEWDAAIDRLSERNRQDFNAVPVFILQGRFVAGGWQRPEMFIEIFERIRTEGPTGPGGTLSQPGGGSWLPGGVFRCQGGGTSGPESAYGGSQYDA